MSLLPLLAVLLCIVLASVSVLRIARLPLSRPFKLLLAGLRIVLFALLAAMFFSPLAAAVPKCATAPALMFVAVLMVKCLKDIDWEDLTEAAPALLTTLAIPFTYSLAAGIGIGFISYVAIKLISGRWRDVNFAVLIIAIAFVAKIVVDAELAQLPIG